MNNIKQLQEEVLLKLEQTSKSNGEITAFWVEPDELLTMTIKAVLDEKEEERLELFLEIF